MHYTGINLTKPVEINRRLLLCFFVIIVAFFYFGVSILLEFPDVKAMMQATMTMSIGIQIIIRLFLYLLDPSPAHVSIASIEKFYKISDGFDEKRQRVLRFFLRRLGKLFFIFMPLHAFCQFFPFLMSFYVYAVKGKAIPPIPAFVYGVARDSFFGYSLNVSLQLLISVMLYMGNPAVDCFYVIVVTHLKPMIDVLKCDLEDLQDFLTEKKEKLVENEKIIKEKLTNIVESHRKILEYYNGIATLISRQFFVLITMNIYCICSSGISLLTSDYTIAIGIGLLYPIQIFFVCTMGSFVRHQHMRLNQILWQFNWYQLPIHHQKHFLYIMLNAQQPISLELLFIGVIDMELYTDVGRILKKGPTLDEFCCIFR
jgi:hypothetical protein